MCDVIAAAPLGGAARQCIRCHATCKVQSRLLQCHGTSCLYGPPVEWVMTVVCPVVHTRSHCGCDSGRARVQRRRCSPRAASNACSSTQTVGPSSSSAALPWRSRPCPRTARQHADSNALHASGVCTHLVPHTRTQLTSAACSYSHGSGPINKPQPSNPEPQPATCSRERTRHSTAASRTAVHASFLSTPGFLARHPSWRRVLLRRLCACRQQAWWR